MNLYDTLGIDKTASKEEIRKAYYQKSKEHHPDAGGNAEEFKKLSAAYEILSDEEKRRRYDAGESAESINKNGTDPVVIALVTVFIGIVETQDVVYTDIFDLVKLHICQVADTVRAEIRTLNRMLDKYKQAKARVKKEKNNIFTQALQMKIEQTQLQIKQKQDNIEFSKKLLDFLQECEYNKEKREHLMSTASTITVTGIYP